MKTKRWNLISFDWSAIYVQHDGRVPSEVRWCALNAIDEAYRGKGNGKFDALQQQTVNLMKEVEFVKKLLSLRSALILGKV